MRTQKAFRHGFSLIELVIVVVIIGIIAAIAIPRMSKGAQGASDSALTANLAVLRNALDLYQTEHNGTWPDATNVAAQLTTYTDAAGGAQAAKDATHVYGPYLRKVPPLPVGAAKGNSGIAAAAAAGIGWIYDGAGTIKSNTPVAETDTAGTPYNTY